MKITRVAHIAVAAADQQQMKAVFGDVLGLPLLREATFESGTQMAMYRMGNVQMEVLHNPSPTSLPGSFLKEKGPGYYHLCLEVEDLAQALEELAAKGVKVLGGAAPRNGASGTPVSFLDPATTGGLLIELAQDGHHKHMES